MARRKPQRYDDDAPYDNDRFQDEEREGDEEEEAASDLDEEEEFPVADDDDDTAVAATDDDDDESLAEGSTGVGDLDTMLEEAEAYAVEGNLDAAIETLSDAVDRFPESPLSHYNLGVVHFMMLREDLEHQELWEDFVDEQGHYEEAVAAFERVLELEENFLGALNNLAALYALRHRIKEAAELLERSLAADPDQSDVRADYEEFQRQLEQADEEE